jgi:hypothetical protein
MDVWDDLELLQTWVHNHAPGGKPPLSASLMTPKARGNKFSDAIAYGGHEAAQARQASPVIKGRTASVRRWDPGVMREG